MGCVMGMHVLDKGAVSVCLDGFTPTSFLEATQQHKVTFYKFVYNYLCLVKSCLVKIYVY